jgi:cation:H+ antiporter
MFGCIEGNIAWAVPALVLGIIAIVRGGDWFVDASCEVAVALNVPKFMIGATIVALATTLPEVMVSFMAHTWTGDTDIALGNVVGSVICNTGLIFGIAVFVLPTVVEGRTVIYQILFLMAAALALVGFAIAGGIPRAGGLVLLAGLAGYLVFSTRAARRHRRANPLPDTLGAPLSGTALRFALGVGLVLLGSRILIAGAVGTARHLGVPQLIISLTLVAFGTSLPELVTSIVAIAKRHGDLSLGNIFGANILNLLLVLGVCSTARPLPIDGRVVVFDLGAMLFLCAAMSVFALTGGRVTRREGTVLLASYIAYLLVIIWRIAA